MLDLFDLPEQWVRNSIAGHRDVGGLKEARAKEVAESMVFLVEGEDGGRWDTFDLILVAKFACVNMGCRRLTSIGSLSNLLLARTKQEKLESRCDVRFRRRLGSIPTIALMRIEGGINIARSIDIVIRIANRTRAGGKTGVLRLHSRSTRIGALIAHGEDPRLASNTTTLVELDGGGFAAWSADSGSVF